ncbi:MAG: hypothetical protein A2186_03405 [Candidatus Levybacteria bacterium RIFOXYA1_FULL_41_10]|nr:MAG: hypothetical protein UT44_C0017G0014 [Candidatus Levybacteria bacterium GW2011_GWA1_39_32]KKR50978.1 MAG: hypothetical protein UT87_C0009G0003 [Candidatus Levybacteria bacterium GW2011_GWC1_40_19]KKR72844.1 MAG: hypothetical protein UU15_C0025G0013 [Candidatus Levybacteria bacterium GW2011_GWC2_40_7]KKR95127.1 MAG: hypothetical protein UU45_C0004G0030 [Candidatus Levybacteria bacterium GW2011_GWA2_41_15]OGH27715.1 MAG: hypothetical protein A3D82_04640 [Candidatus Levybacteria bacterium 
MNERLRRFGEGVSALGISVGGVGIGGGVASIAIEAQGIEVTDKGLQHGVIAAGVVGILSYIVGRRIAARAEREPDVTGKGANSNLG